MKRFNLCKIPKIITVTVDDDRSMTITEKAWFSRTEKTTTISYFDIETIERKRFQKLHSAYETHVITLKSYEYVVLPCGKNAEFDAFMEKLESEKRCLDPLFKIEQDRRQDIKKGDLRLCMVMIFLIPGLTGILVGGILQNYVLSICSIIVSVFLCAIYLRPIAKAEKRRQDEELKIILNRAKESEKHRD